MFKYPIPNLSDIIIQNILHSIKYYAIFINKVIESYQ